MISLMRWYKLIGLELKMDQKILYNYIVANTGVASLIMQKLFESENHQLYYEDLAPLPNPPVISLNLITI